MEIFETGVLLHISDVVLYFMNSFRLVLLRGQIIKFLLNYLIFCLKRIHDNANVVYASMFSDSTFS